MVDTPVQDQHVGRDEILGGARTLNKVTRGATGKLGALGKVGWWASAGLAVADIYQGYKENGWRGAASAAIDAVAVAGPGIVVGSATTALVTGGTLGVGAPVGVVAGMGTGYLASDWAAKNLLPWAHKLEGALGLPVVSSTPDESGPSLVGRTYTYADSLLSGTAPIAEAAAAPVVLASYRPGGGARAPDVPPANPPNDDPTHQQIIDAAKHGKALYDFNQAELAPDQRAALLAADKGTLEGMRGNIEAARRNHQKIILGVEGHVDDVGAATSTRNMSLADMRANQAADVLQQAAKDMGFGDDIEIKAAGKGVGTGNTALEKRSASIHVASAPAATV